MVHKNNSFPKQKRFGKLILWIVGSLVLTGYIFLLGFLYLDFDSKAAYPGKPVTIIVHSKPGSSIDLMSRKVADIAQRISDVVFVVENRPGTQGLVAMQHVLDKKADGYTLLGVTKSFLSTVQVNRSKVSMNDFQFVANMISDPEAIITNKQTGIDGLDELITDAKNKKGEQRWIGPGVGSRDHLMAMKTWKTLNIEAQWIDYKSGPQSVLAMLRNEAPVYVGNPSDIRGKEELKIIALAGKQRLKDLEDIPTFAENGFPLYETMWRGFAFKKGVPPERVRFIEDLLRKVSQDSDWLAYCDENFVFSDFIGSKGFSTAIKTEIRETNKYLNKANLLAQYVSKGKTDMWLAALLIFGGVYFVLFILIKFDIQRFTIDVFVTGLIIGMALLLFYETMLYNIPDEANITHPALIPRIWIVLILLLSIILIGKKLKKPQEKKKTSVNMRKTVRILLLLFVYFIAVQWIGYFISTPAFLIAGMYALNYRRFPVIAINAFGFVLFSYLIFDVLLKVDLPMGRLFY